MPMHSTHTASTRVTPSTQQKAIQKVIVLKWVSQLFIYAVNSLIPVIVDQ